ncbi:TetR/AcrR family transcriptional regulator [Kitasatospora viridis]|uniref:TetR/AcrR family transcriptional regulator n=1 Tax=Kitasatospora viridis TaxID=281105 RepID=UPI001FE95236|nr:TetR/AcrR family transcriptional regulator [Kitasatospora viridis]
MSTPPPARDRILETASRLFYAEGIHAVGVDRIVTEAGVTRATFYRHFPGKEELIRSYLVGRDAALREGAAKVLASGATGAEGVLLVVERLGAKMRREGFRGCPFINAAAEYPDPAHPVSVAIAAHRAWLLGLFTELLRGGGWPDPRATAEHLVLLRDGAMVGAALGDPVAVARRLTAAVAGVLSAAGRT